MQLKSQPNFYENLVYIEKLLENNFNIQDISPGLIMVNNVLVDTNTQFPMLTPNFFTATAERNPMIKDFRQFFQNTGILPKQVPNIPIIRDIPLRKSAQNPSPDEYKFFAKFLEEDLLPNHWTHIFEEEFAQLQKEIQWIYNKKQQPLQQKKIVKNAEGKDLESGGYIINQYKIAGLDLWLFVPENDLPEKIQAAIDKSLNDTMNVNTIIAEFKLKLAMKNQIVFNVRGVDNPKDLAKNALSSQKNLNNNLKIKLQGVLNNQIIDREILQNIDLTGGHQYFLLLDKNVKTIYGINNTRGASDDDMRAFKSQIALFLKEIGDNTEYQFKSYNGKSRQPNTKEHVQQICSVSQFFHYVAVLAGVDVNEIKDEIPAKVTTLMYLLQYSSEVRNQEELKNILTKLIIDLNQQLLTNNIQANAVQKPKIQQLNYDKPVIIEKKPMNNQLQYQQIVTMISEAKNKPNELILNEPLIKATKDFQAIKISLEKHLKSMLELQFTDKNERLSFVTLMKTINDSYKNFNIASQNSQNDYDNLMQECRSAFKIAEPILEKNIQANHWLRNFFKLLNIFCGLGTYLLRRYDLKITEKQDIIKNYKFYKQQIIQDNEIQPEDNLILQ